MFDVNTVVDANNVFHRPEKPLKWLSDFLAQKSRELENEVG